MLTFIIGFIIGILVFFLARLADKKASIYIERFEKTGKVSKSQPVIIEGNDSTRQFIDEHFDIAP